MNFHAAKAFILDKLRRELSPHLTYHGLHHTLDVLTVAEELAELERISPYDRLLLKTAVLFHDCGFTVQYRNHEEIGCEIARRYLPDYGYLPGEIQRICGMILATRIPQSPTNLLEMIICDADLDYLGRDDFYRIGNTLYDEFRHHDILHEEEAWNRLQVAFLEHHHYFTETTKRRRAAKKQQHLDDLRDLVSRYATSG